MSYEKTDRAAAKRSRTVRAIVLAAVFVLVTGAAYLHQAIGGAGKPPGVDALCPFGGLETLFSVLAGGALLKNIAVSSIVLFVGTIVLALVLRRSFCGQVCPLGAMQGAFGWLGTKIFRGKRPQLPKAVDRPARFLKYAVLAVFLLWTWWAAALVMRPYDPWAAWAHITSDELLLEFGIGAAVLGISLVGSIVYDRFFCKYLCPMGAFLGLFSKLSFLRIRRDADACIDCGKCDKACPMNVTVATVDTVTASECISCNECVNACPAAGALEVKAGQRTLTPLAVTGVVVGTLAAMIAFATVTGNFSWTMPSLSEAIEASGGTVGESFDSSLVKGYMSMGEIAAASGVPREEFTAAFGVPDSELDQPMKDIKGAYGFSPHDVGAWVDEYLATQ